MITEEDWDLGVEWGVMCDRSNDEFGLEDEDDDCLPQNKENGVMTAMKK